MYIFLNLAMKNILLNLVRTFLNNFLCIFETTLSWTHNVVIVRLLRSMYQRPHRCKTPKSCQDEEAFFGVRPFKPHHALPPPPRTPLYPLAPLTRTGKAVTALDRSNNNGNDTKRLKLICLKRTKLKI